MCLTQRAGIWTENIVNERNTQTHRVWKGSGYTVVLKEGYADSFQGHESTYHYRYPLKKSDYKQIIFFATSWEKLSLFIECLQYSF